MISAIYVLARVPLGFQVAARHLGVLKMLKTLESIYSESLNKSA